MTAIVIWQNNEQPQYPGLWVVADSRISSAGSVVTDAGAKIFALPVVCRMPGPSGFFTEVCYSHSYGYCFAGSTLLGQNTYLEMLPLLGNLIVNRSNSPSFKEVSAYVFGYLRNAYDEYKQIAGPASMFEVALFGYCTRESKLFASKYYPELVDGIYQLTRLDIDLSSSGTFLYLGDHRESMSAEIRAAVSQTGEQPPDFQRMPRYKLQEIIEAGAYASIGGDIQLGIANSLGFNPYSILKPRIRGQSNAYYSYLGRELTPELSQVGPAMVATGAMI